MKTKLTTLIATLVFITLGNFASAQARDFDGLWSGKIEKDDGSSLDIELYIDDNNVYATYVDSDGDLAKDLSKEVVWSKGYAQQLNFVWMNAGGAWTETQIFSLVWISENKLSIYFTRHVSNVSDETDGNTDWGYTAKGYLYLD